MYMIAYSMTGFLSIFIGSTGFANLFSCIASRNRQRIPITNITGPTIYIFALISVNERLTPVTPISKRKIPRKSNFYCWLKVRGFLNGISVNKTTPFVAVFRMWRMRQFLSMITPEISGHIIPCISKIILWSSRFFDTSLGLEYFRVIALRDAIAPATATPQINLKTR